MTKDTKGVTLHLEFIDILAYYIPGVLFLMSLLIWDKIINLGLLDMITTTNTLLSSKTGYVQGMIWTTMVVIVPYIIGHLAFPLSLLIGRLFGKAHLAEDTDKSICKFLRENNSYCSLENYAFARCISRCLRSDNLSCFNLWATRFRIFNRFYNALSMPLLFIAVSLLTFSGKLIVKNESINLSIFIIIISLLLIVSVFGIMDRSKKYELRWRNSVCSNNNT